MQYSSLKTRLLVCAAVVAGAELTAAPAMAQAPAPDSAVLDELIVTARRRDENIYQVPVAITAVSGPELQRRAIETRSSR